MQNFRLQQLLFLLFFILLSTNLLAQETTIIEKLNLVIKPVRTLKLDRAFDDIDFLKDIIKDKEIIALGEVTHGTKEVFDYKARLIRYMVTNLNYKNIAFEADHNRMEYFDSYINGKMDSTGIRSDYKAILIWLKQYNKSQSVQNKVHIYGLELRDFGPAVDKILATNNGITQPDKDVLLKIKTTAFDNIDKETLAKFRKICTQLPSDLHNKMLIQLIDNYFKFISLSSKIGVRDAFMAKNAVAIKESTADKKLIIWAHNGHVAKTSLYNKPAMGEFLAKEYGNKYYVIATDINKGYVTVRKYIARNRPISNFQSLYYSEVESAKAYEYYFKQTQYKNFILDINGAVADKQLQQFLTKPKEMRAIGALSIPVNKKLSLADNYDMVVYFNETNSL
jgi:erythromycin esterase